MKISSVRACFSSTYAPSFSKNMLRDIFISVEIFHSFNGSFSSLHILPVVFHSDRPTRVVKKLFNIFKDIYFIFFNVKV